MTLNKNELYREYMRILKDDTFFHQDSNVYYKKTVLEEDLKIVYKHYYKNRSNKTEIYMSSNIMKSKEKTANIEDYDSYDEDYEII
jgi:hypothetical protein